MQLENLNISHAGEHYVGFAFAELPLEAARQVAAQQIDAAANQARLAVVGDPLRAFEYQLAETEARQFTGQDYQGEPPKAVYAWAKASGLSAREATQDILEKARLWNQSLQLIREIRLVAKQSVLKASNHVDTQGIVEQTLAKFTGEPLDL